jgi:thiol-disulfide isomerase/thioredoxin
MAGSFSRKRKRSLGSRVSSGRLSPPVDVNSIDKISKFESLIGPVFVLIYADWCGHCQKYKPMWKELEDDPNRSINMASIRDDMVSKTSLTQRADPIQSYPTVVLINKEGRAVNFKSESGAETQSVPDHTNMESMRAIVRNIGTPAGNNILKNSDIETLKHPQIEPQTFTQVETYRQSNISPPNIAADVVLSSTPTPIKSSQQKGGSLYNILTKAAYSAAPAILLFSASSAIDHNKRNTRRRKTNKKRRGSKN